MSKTPVLGVCECPECQGEMTIRRKKTGRGGVKTMLFGYCNCKTMLQGAQHQAQLSAALNANVEPEVAPVAVVDDFDPAELNAPVDDDNTPEPTGKRRPGALKVVGCIFALGLGCFGLGKLVSQ